MPEYLSSDCSENDILRRILPVGALAEDSIAKGTSFLQFEQNQFHGGNAVFDGVVPVNGLLNGPLQERFR